MGKRSNFERIPHDFYPTLAAAMPPLLPFLRGMRRFASPLVVTARWCVIWKGCAASLPTTSQPARMHLRSATMAMPTLSSPTRPVSSNLLPTRRMGSPAVIARRTSKPLESTDG